MPRKPAATEEKALPKKKRGTVAAKKKTAQPAAPVPARQRKVKAVPSAPRVRKAASPAAEPAIRLFLARPGRRGNAQANGFEHCALQRAKPGTLPYLDAMRRISADPTLKGCPGWGVLPQDFTDRTGLGAAELRQLINRHPGYDLYYLDAHPEQEAVFHNPWQQAEIEHPGFLALMREFFAAVGLPDQPLDAITHSALFATGNLVIARPAFWEKYLAFCERVLAQAREKLGSDTQNALFGEAAAPDTLRKLDLLFARLPGIFLMMKEPGWRACKLPLPGREAALNPHLRLLREMKDLALTRRSRWMVLCWANYRTLYFAQAMGKEWATRHFKTLNPERLNLVVPTGTIDYAYPRTDQADQRVAAIPENH